MGERGDPRSGQRIREGERLVVEYSIIYLINSSIQEVYRPLVKRLGFEYPAGEHPSTTKLRTESITIAATRDEKECVAFRVLKAFLTSSEGSSRSSNPASTILSKPETIQGSRPTWRLSSTGSQSSMEARNSGNLSKASTRLERPPRHVSLQCESVSGCRKKNLGVLTPKSRALGETQDLDVAKETLDYMWTEAKDQDFIYFFSGLSTNAKTRRLLKSYVFENYEKVR